MVPSSQLSGGGNAIVVAEVVAGDTVEKAAVGTSLQMYGTENDVTPEFAPHFSLGSEYRGRWTDPRTLALEIMDVRGTSPFAETRVGSFAISIKAEGSLKAADLSSDVSSLSHKSLTGSWGAHLKSPVVVLVEAMDSSASLGFANGDSIRMAFDKRTNTPPIETKANIDAIFVFFLLALAMVTRVHGLQGLHLFIQMRCLGVLWSKISVTMA